MKFDLAFVLVDLGNPWYKTAASEMIRSARRAYKDHDMRVVQITDSKTAHHPDADGVFGGNVECSAAQMCQFKGHFIAEYALQAENPVIFTDVDMIWNNDGAIELLEAEPVVLAYRENMPSMPFNAGFIATHGQNDFWRHYREAMDNMPVEVRGWWGDQFGLLAPILKTERYKDWGWVLMDNIAPAIDKLPAAPLTTPAVHFKGKRKSMMVPYARMLDKGEGFEFARPSASQNYDQQRQGWAF